MLLVSRLGYRKDLQDSFFIRCLFRLSGVDSVLTRGSGFPLQLIGQNGASNRVRTDDLLFTKQLLYQLSYRGKILKDGKGDEDVLPVESKHQHRALVL